MADIERQYNHTWIKWMNQEANKASVKIMLLDATGVFNATHTTIDQVAGAVTGGHRPREVYGNGWTEGGELLTSLTITGWNINGFMIDAADTRKTATGGSIGPYDFVVAYDSVTDAVYWHIENEVPGKIAGEATDNVVVWNSGGIFRAYLPA